jgi:hypothetical protein
MGKKPARQRVSFTATKMVSKPVKVSFNTRTGKRVSFTATKKVPKSVRVTFYKRKGR